MTSSYKVWGTLQAPFWKQAFVVIALLIPLAPLLRAHEEIGKSSARIDEDPHRRKRLLSIAESGNLCLVHLTFYLSIAVKKTPRGVS